MSTDWKNYHKKTKNYTPRKLLVKALGYLNRTDNQEVLDLGAGALNDSLYLLEQGFYKVTAVDKTPVPLEWTATLPSEKFEYVVSSFEEFTFISDKYDLVSAQFALPFINIKEFDNVFKNLIISLKKGGIISCQLFGDRDEWSKNKEMTFHKKEHVEELFNDLELIYLEEEEKDSVTVSGDMKHWHIFHIIARR